MNTRRVFNYRNVFVSLVIAVLASSLIAETQYVDSQKGNDANSNTQEKLLRTIGEPLNEMETKERSVPLDVEGIWLGNLKAMGSDLGIIFRICRNSDGTLIVAIDFPDHNMNNIPVEKVTIDDDALGLDIKTMNATFDGKIAKEGTTIKGDWGKGGFTVPIALNRVSEAEVNKYLEAKSHKKFLKPNELKEDLDFLKESFKKMQEQQVVALIIDMRNNEGGSSHLGDLLLDYITDKPFRQLERYDLKLSKQLIDLHIEMSTEKPDDLAAVYSKVGSLTTQHIPLKTPRNNPLRFDGSIFVLIDHFTFSSAQSFASAIKCFSIATIIGEETGGTTTEYGEIMTFTMPNSGLMFSSPCKYFIEACGKQDRRGVIPDYEVGQRPKDTAKGVDTVLQFTLDLINRN